VQKELPDALGQHSRIASPGEAIRQSASVTAISSIGREASRRLIPGGLRG
jgi:hypothetical protein